jgi:phosphatidylinositol glycan class S
MAEITESPPEAPGETHQTSETTRKGQELESDFDPKTMRKSKPGLKRLSLTLSVLFSFLLGPVPLLYHVHIYDISYEFVFASNL